MANDFLNALADNLNLTDEQLNQLAANASAWRDSELKQLAADVAKAETGTKITRRGFDLLAKAVAGQELQFTRIKLGDANGKSTTDDEEYEFNDLINPKFEAAISQVQFRGGGIVSVVARVQNARVTDGFRISEVGLFAIDPDSGEEQLYCYRNSALAASWMPSGDSAVLWDLSLSILTVIDKATNITAVIDGGLVYLTQAEFLEHVASENPHPNIPVKAQSVTETNYVWVSGSDEKLHPMATDQLANQILGGDAANIPKMNSRLTEAEINLLNLYMQLNATTDLGLDGNLLMVEPFTSKDCCDMYSCNVLTAVAGIANITIDNDKNIQVGSYYTITDGTRSEYVQVKSVARNADAVIAILEENLTLTYDLSRTQLLRTTALIADERASGAGDIRSTTLTFGETFSGTGGNVAQTLNLETTQTNAANFTVTDDGQFTLDGYFTISA